jgi:hypothetical protein
MRGTRASERAIPDPAETTRGRRRTRGTAGVAARLAARLVDPWGPSRLRRWLHVTGAQDGGTGRIRERARPLPQVPIVGAPDLSFPHLEGGVAGGPGAPTDCIAADAVG